MPVDEFLHRCVGRAVRLTVVIDSFVVYAGISEEGFDDLKDLAARFLRT
jgi:hypothetical protein